VNGPTPDQLRKTKEAFQQVGEYWFVDLNTKELRRKSLSGFKWFTNLFWKKRHSVWEFYWWIRYRQAEPDMTAFENPIHSDNLPILGFPMKYELLNGWTIPKDDLKYLVNGPLASEGLSEILVPHALGWQRVIQFFKQYAAPIISGAVVIFGSILRYWPEISLFLQSSA